MVRLPTCPICKHLLPAADTDAPSFSPFCSERCRSIDLLRWTDGRYAIVEPLDPLRHAELLEDDDPTDVELE